MTNPDLDYQKLTERNPIDYLSKTYSVNSSHIEEIYRLCETDFRFKKNRYIEYKEISEYTNRFWNVDLTPRQIKYIHNVISKHNELMAILKKGGKIKGSYRDLVLRKS